MLLQQPLMEHLVAIVQRGEEVILREVGRPREILVIGAGACSSDRAAAGRNAWETECLTLLDSERRPAIEVRTLNTLRPCRMELVVATALLRFVVVLRPPNTHFAVVDRMVALRSELGAKLLALRVHWRRDQALARASAGTWGLADAFRRGPDRQVSDSVPCGRSKLILVR
jgi:hypothetical protein